MQFLFLPVLKTCSAVHHSQSTPIFPTDLSKLHQTMPGIPPDALRHVSEAAQTAFGCVLLQISTCTKPAPERPDKQARASQKIFFLVKKKRVSLAVSSKCSHRDKPKKKKKSLGSCFHAANFHEPAATYMK